jgi:hypothetical protein
VTKSQVLNMRLREPFAVYFVTQGHVVQHAALFFGSLFVKNTPDEIAMTDKLTISEFDNAFSQVRWVHFTVFILEILSRFVQGNFTKTKLKDNSDSKEDDTKQK